MEQTENQTKEFFSQTPGLTIHWKVGELKQMGDRMVRIGEKHLSFTPFTKGVKIGNQVFHFGRYSTGDPEEIAFLESRCKNEKDVMTAQEFARFQVPPEDQIAQQAREIDRLKSELASVLEQQGKRPRQVA